MPRGSPALKLAITVDRDVHAKVVRAAKAEHTSVSAWMTAAARRSLLMRDGLAAIAEWEAQHGRLSEDELEAARVCGALDATLHDAMLLRTERRVAGGAWVTVRSA